MEQVQAAFSDWQKAQIESPDGEFVAKENCNLDYVINTEGTAMLGFPEEINFYYADVNDDGRTDALITFSPDQCDGGNAMAWTQYKILVTSDDNNDYSVNESSLDVATASLVKGPYFLDSLSGTNAYGRYYEFLDGDARCCPSISGAMIIDLKTMKVDMGAPEE